MKMSDDELAKYWARKYSSKLGLETVIRCAIDWVRSEYPAPSPKVDMGPCGLSEDEKEALDHVEQYPNSHNWTMVRTLALCVRRLLSSTPPDPSSAAKDAVIEAAKKWRSKHNGNRMLSHEDDLSVAVDRLAALDQEKP